MQVIELKETVDNQLDKMSPPDIKSVDDSRDSQSDVLSSSQSQEIDEPYNAKTPVKSKVPIRSIITVVVLVYINLLNYMDRQTLAGKYS